MLLVIWNNHQPSEESRAQLAPTVELPKVKIASTARSYGRVALGKNREHSSLLQKSRAQLAPTVERFAYTTQTKSLWYDIRELCPAGFSAAEPLLADVPEFRETELSYVFNSG